MSRKTLADVTGSKGPSNNVLAAPWPYLLAGAIIFGVGAWSMLGGSTEHAQGQAAQDQARQVSSQMSRVVLEVQEMLRSDDVQSLAEGALDGTSRPAELLTAMRALVPEVTDVQLYGSDVFMANVATLGDDAYIKLDMMASALENELSPVQLLNNDGLSYLGAASTIGRAVQGKGFVIVYFDPAVMLDLFSIASPASGYIGLEHAAGANSPNQLREVGTGIPAGYIAQRMNVNGSLLRVVYPATSGGGLIGQREQWVLLLLGLLLLGLGLVRRQALRKEIPTEETMPEHFATLRDGELPPEHRPPTLRDARREATLAEGPSERKPPPVLGGLQEAEHLEREPDTAESLPLSGRLRGASPTDDQPPPQLDTPSPETPQPEAPGPEAPEPPASSTPGPGAPPPAEDIPLVGRISQPVEEDLSGPQSLRPEPPESPSEPTRAGDDDLAGMDVIDVGDGPGFSIPTPTPDPGIGDAPQAQTPAGDTPGEPAPLAPAPGPASGPAVDAQDEPASLEPAPGPAAPAEPPTIPPEPAHQATAVRLKSHIFRAYDIRGIVGESLDRGVAYQIGQAVGSLAQDSLATPVAVGRDGRHSGPDLVDGLIEGLSDSGCPVVDVGAVPTGVLYFAANEMAKGSGVMVTGSHNPPDYNGFKIMIGGRTLAGDDIFGLFERIRTGNLHHGEGAVTQADALAAYKERITGDIQLKQTLKIAVDCGNGIGGVNAVDVLQSIGAEVVPLFEEVDGNFPNHHPDPSEPKNLTDLIDSVKLTQADLGLAFDGDADRLGVVTADGDIVYSDRIMMLYARDVLERNPGATIIYDVKCTGHLDTVIREAGGVPEMYKTGHSLMKNRLKEVGSPLAGEMSGHFFFGERWYGFDCGIYAACRLLEILAARDESPTEVLSELPNSVSTPELKVELAEGENHAFIESFKQHAKFPGARINIIDGVRADFADGWGLVRASNTTPILVLRFDADSEQALKNVQEAFRAQLLAVRADLDLPF